LADLRGLTTTASGTGRRGRVPRRPVLLAEGTTTTVLGLGRAGGSTGVEFDRRLCRGRGPPLFAPSPRRPHGWLQLGELWEDRVSLKIETTTRNATAIVRLIGELDITSADQAERELSEIEARMNDVVFDLRDLSFIDSTGLRIILSADSRARERGGRVVIVRGPAPVDRVFKLALLDERLELVDSLAQAEGVEG
jgi:anti-sigma B factor antagonist